MTDLIDTHETGRIAHSEKDTNLSLSDAVTFLVEKFLRTRGPRIGLQGIQALND